VLPLVLPLVLPSPVLDVASTPVSSAGPVADCEPLWLPDSLSLTESLASPPPVDAATAPEELSASLVDMGPDPLVACEVPLCEVSEPSVSAFGEPPHPVTMSRSKGIRGFMVAPDKSAGY